MKRPKMSLSKTVFSLKCHLPKAKKPSNYGLFCSNAVRTLAPVPVCLRLSADYPHGAAVVGYRELRDRAAGLPVAGEGHGLFKLEVHLGGAEDVYKRQREGQPRQRG